MTRLRTGSALLAIAVPAPAAATGSEMSGLALAVPLLILVCLFLLLVFAGVAYLFLPASWPKPKRWIVAAAAAPSMLGVLVLVTSGMGVLQLALAKWLL